jgi:sirohydrochlorin cobaltochelatase
MTDPEGRGAVWTGERGTSDEVGRRLDSAPGAERKHGMTGPPLLLAAHGTRDAAGVAAFAALANRVAALGAADGTAVAGGFIELSAPPVRSAVTALVGEARRAQVGTSSGSAAVGGPATDIAVWSAAAGHDGTSAGSNGGPPVAGRIVAVPLMLSAAGHAKGDVPAALARESARHPGLIWHYGRPLGPHPALQDLLAARIAAVSAGFASPPAVLLVGRGSTDPDANADVAKTARLLWEGRDFPLAETAFVSLARPGVAEGLERCRLLGAREIVVARYFLFPGVLPDRVTEQAVGYAREHPELDVRCTDVLGDCDEIAALVYERYHEALAGDIRMNCDTCVYRSSMPGFEHRVGAPQHPHDHPHDPANPHPDPRDPANPHPDPRDPANSHPDPRDPAHVHAD